MPKKRVADIARERGLEPAEVARRLALAGVKLSGDTVDEAAAARALGGSRPARNGRARGNAPAAARPAAAPAPATAPARTPAEPAAAPRTAMPPGRRDGDEVSQSDLSLTREGGGARPRPTGGGPAGRVARPQRGGAAGRR